MTQKYDSLRDTLTNARSLISALSRSTDEVTAVMLEQIDHHLAAPSDEMVERAMKAAGMMENTFNRARMRAALEAALGEK
jgi:hypothetical protein